MHKKDDPMSSSWLNIRWKTWHLIIGENHLLDIRVSKNKYHEDNPRKFEVYTLRIPSKIFP